MEKAKNLLQKKEQEYCDMRKKACEEGEETPILYFKLVRIASEIGELEDKAKADKLGRKPKGTERSNYTAGIDELKGDAAVKFDNLLADTTNGSTSIHEISNNFIARTAPMTEEDLAKGIAKSTTTECNESIQKCEARKKYIEDKFENIDDKSLVDLFSGNFKKILNQETSRSDITQDDIKAAKDFLKNEFKNIIFKKIDQKIDYINNIKRIVS
ncbi:MAG: hypothetical protein LBR91_01405 [Puniceicoccales bacterium]|jgi:hypothetical protein|nr:hypothetical protein [Puniceicoccales bacterium]